MYSTSLTSPKGATAFTKSLNAAALADLPFHDKQDFTDAHRGFIMDFPDRKIFRDDLNSQGTSACAVNMNDYNFIDRHHSAPGPATVHPSLWRQAQLNSLSGLFKVCDRVYQIRGCDISNMTIIEGDSGLILIDPLLVVETAKAGLALYHQYRPEKQTVHAIMITHSHADHFGGIRGVLPNGEPDEKVQIIAPEGFLEHAVSENVFAGNAMRRRAHYMYGNFIPKSDRGHVDVGLGKALAGGRQSLLSPNDLISRTGEKRIIDGVEFEFQMANCTEAPCEMIIYLPQLRALCGAEVMTHNMHNLYTLRGAEIRDAVQWWKTIHEAINIFLHRSDVIFAQHHWPIWGQENIGRFLTKQRDLYKYLHDETLRLMNHGLNMNEIANTIVLPPALSQEWYNRGYYGTTSHNVRGIYQRYLGFYSSNPAELDPLPPVEESRRYVDFMGGADAVVDRAQTCFNQGEYKWVARVLSHVMYTEPDHTSARKLLADTFEQLGYQAEAATWRNEYLSAATELRMGLPKIKAKGQDLDFIQAMTLEMLFDYLGVRLNGPKADGLKFAIDFRFEGPLSSADPHRIIAMVQNSVLVYTLVFTDGIGHITADVIVSLPRPVFVGLCFGSIQLEKASASGMIKMQGDQTILQTLLSLFDSFNPVFPLVTRNNGMISEYSNFGSKM